MIGRAKRFAASIGSRCLIFFSRHSKLTVSSTIPRASRILPAAFGEDRRMPGRLRLLSAERALHDGSFARRPATPA